MKPTTAPTATPDQALLPTDQLGADTTTTTIALTSDEHTSHIEHWLEFLRQLVALRAIPVEPLEGRTPTYTDTPVPAGYSVAVRANTSGIRLADPPSLSTHTREDLLRLIVDHGVVVERATWHPSLIGPIAGQSVTASPPTLSAILSAAPKPRQ